MGHVFRDKSPYTFPGGVAKIVLHNAARVAEVWLDEWRDFYYAMSTGSMLFKFFSRKSKTATFTKTKKQLLSKLVQFSVFVFFCYYNTFNIFKKIHEILRILKSKI